MFSKEQASAIRTEFYTDLGRIMRKTPNSEGKRIKWMNYNTGVKNMFFKLHSDSKTSWIGIEINHKDVGIQELFYEQMLELKTYLHNILGEEWVWEPLQENKQNQTITRIYLEQPGKTVLRETDRPELMEFFKSRLFKLDEFWEDAKESFLAL